MPGNEGQWASVQAIMLDTLNPTSQRFGNEWKLRPGTARTINDPAAVQAFTRKHVPDSLKYEQQRRLESFVRAQLA